MGRLLEQKIQSWFQSSIVRGTERETLIERIMVNMIVES